MTPDGDATHLPPPEPPPEAQRRLKRLRVMAWLLDRSIPIGGGWRIGLDPLLGLLPGAGDALGALFSVSILYDAARLGLPWRVLVRMAGNILIEAVVGLLPVFGDLFDFVWQANMRNLRLVEKFYHPRQSPRSGRQIALALGLFALLLLALIATGMYFLVQGISALSAGR